MSCSLARGSGPVPASRVWSCVCAMASGRRPATAMKSRHRFMAFDVTSGGMEDAVPLRAPPAEPALGAGPATLTDINDPPAAYPGVQATKVSACLEPASGYHARMHEPMPARGRPAPASPNTASLSCTARPCARCWRIPATWATGRPSPTAGTGCTWTPTWPTAGATAAADTACSRSDARRHPATQPPQPHYQSLDYNRLNGGIERWYQPIDADDRAPDPRLRTVLQLRLVAVRHRWRPRWRAGTWRCTSSASRRTRTGPACRRPRACTATASTMCW